MAVGVTMRVVRWLAVAQAVLTLLCALIVQARAATSAPAGCVTDGTQLTSCSGYNATASGSMLALNKLGIASVSAGAFTGVVGVNAVNLSGNAITSLAPDTFAAVSSITTLCVLGLELWRACMW